MKVGWLEQVVFVYSFHHNKPTDITILQCNLKLHLKLQARTALTEARTRGGDFGVTEEAEAR